MFPYAKDCPPAPTQFPRHLPVALPIPGDFRQPEHGVGLRDRAIALRTTVPKTAVHEQGHALGSPDEVRVPEYGGLSAPSGDARSPKRRRHAKFCSHVSARPHSLHRSRSADGHARPAPLRGWSVAVDRFRLHERRERGGAMYKVSPKNLPVDEYSPSAFATRFLGGCVYRFRFRCHRRSVSPDVVRVSLSVAAAFCFAPEAPVFRSMGHADALSRTGILRALVRRNKASPLRPLFVPRGSDSGGGAWPEYARSQKHPFAFN
jgi:hypothetical protein